LIKIMVNGVAEYKLTKAEKKLADAIGYEFWEDYDYSDFNKLIPKLAKAAQAVMDERAVAAKVVKSKCKSICKGGKR
jgi:hypothetical protein